MTIPMWIGGEPLIPPKRDKRTVVNPVSREPFGEMVLGSTAEIDLAVKVAADRFPKWSKSLPEEREKVLLDAASILLEEQADLAKIIMLESGSTLQKSLHEVTYSAQMLRAAAGEARRLYGQTMPDDKRNRFSLVVREPIGVVGVISPFNAPLALLVKMLSFPLAAGNTIVVKPSEETPQIAIALAKVFARAKLSAGVLNIVTGLGQSAGAALVGHQGIAGLTFTGSTKTGRMIGKTLGENLKIQHLELGGNNPLIVCRDFPIAEAARLAVTGSFFHSGQICMASSRILVDESVIGDFREEFLGTIAKQTLGDLSDQRTFYGPLINESAVQRMKEVVTSADSTGARRLCGGAIHDGWRFAPTVYENVPSQSILWQEEVFGPICSLQSFQTLSQAQELANSTPYGLSCGILTKEYQTALHLAEGIQSGGIHIGSHPFQSGTMTPVGGVGHSGIGKSGGSYSTNHFTHERWISFNQFEEQSS